MLYNKKKRSQAIAMFNHSMLMEENAPLPEETKSRTIDLSSDEKITYWAKELSCNKADLHYAILNVGHSYMAVEAFLSMNHRTK